MSKLAHIQGFIESHPTEFATTVSSVPSMKALLRHFGVEHSDPRLWKLLHAAISNNNISVTHWHGVGSKYAGDEAELREMVASSKTLSEVIRRLKLKNHGATSNWLKGLLAAKGIDFSHFIPGHRGDRWARSDDEVFVENSPHARSSLRGRVLRSGFLPYACAVCANPGEWMGTQLDLELDHINGICDDNRRTNLRWLCPNCHKQTETFGSKTRK